MDALGLVILLTVFQLKHLMADYFLQGEYMLGKFKLKNWEIPLLAHSSVHMLMTFAIASFYIPLKYAAALAFVDMCIHFVIDRVKVVTSRGYDKSVDKEYWWLLGMDQTAHHLTHYAIAFYIFLMVQP